MRYIFFYLVSTFLALNLFAQNNIQTYNWKTYTSFNSVTTVLEIDNELWVGTKGGIVIFDSLGNQKQSYTTANGLLDLNVSSLYYDQKSKSVFVGFENGIIDVFRDKEWKHITDIFDAAKQYPSRRVNTILSREDTLYVASSFGLAFFDTRTLTPLGQIDKLNTLASLTAVNKIVIWKNELYALTPKVLLKTPLNKSLLSLQISENWVELNNSTFQYAEFTDLVESNHQLFLSADTTVYSYTDTSFSKVYAADYPIIKLQYFPNSPLIITSLFSIKFAGADFDIYFSNNENNVSIGRIATSLYQENKLFVGFENTGFGKRLGKNSLQLYANDGILSNSITSIGIDGNSIPWIATGGNPAGFGFSFQEDKKWKFFEKISSPFIKDNVYDNVSTLSNGEVWLGSYGVGTMRAIPTDTGYRFIRYDNLNSPLKGAVSSDPNYVITGQTCLDFQGNKWVINRYTDGPILSVLSANEEWKSVSNSITGLNDFNEIQIDRFGTFWMKSANRFQQLGIVYFNPNRTIELTSDDKWGKISDISSTFPSNPTSMAVDDNSVIWVGSTSGLWRIINTSSILQDRSPTIIKSQLLSNQTINHIGVDAINQKWISTNEGIWVLNEDGTEVVLTINTLNSPLITDIVSTINFDKKNGVVFVGTSEGLQSFESPIITPSSEFALNCFPSPFNLQTHPFMTVKGLEVESEIIILTSNGSLVKSISTTSGSINWDGKDEKGQYVTSGIYIISARSSINNTTTIKKIFVKNGKNGG